MKITIDSVYCKGCLLCVGVCKKGVLALGAERSKGGYLMPYAKEPDNCIACKLCEITCPDVCIEVTKD